MEGREPHSISNSHDAPSSSFKSVASLSSDSSLTVRSFDFSGYPPQAELEELPSSRWLPSGDIRPAAAPSETVLSSRERDAPFRQRQQREHGRPGEASQTASPSPVKISVLQYAHDDMTDAADPNAAVTDSQFPPSTNHQKYGLEGVSEGLPAVENFRIIGDAKPGSALKACGFPKNGTTRCMFQWVRHLEDGSWRYIEGATHPVYVVTADDVGKRIAVECIPMDVNGRQVKGVQSFDHENLPIEVVR